MKEDLIAYQTRVRDPIVGKLKHLGLTMYSPEPPSGGVVVQYILRLLDGKCYHIVVQTWYTFYN